MSVVNGGVGSDPAERDDQDRERGSSGPAGRGAPSHQGSWFEVASEPATPGGGYAGVVFNRPIEQVLTYRVPERLWHFIRPGQRVRVPLGRGDRPVVGYCVRVDPEPPDALELKQIKNVVELLDSPPLIDQKMLDLTRWLADYYACSWGQASMPWFRLGSRSTRARGSAPFSLCLKRRKRQCGQIRSCRV